MEIPFFVFQFTLLVLNVAPSLSIKCDPLSPILDFSNRNLTDLDIFEECQNLTTLILRNNNLSWLHDNVFDNLTELEHLDLSSNNLRNISGEVFGSLEKLQILNLDNNSLESLDFLTTAVGLIELSASFNQIKALTNVHICIQMKKFNVSHNQIEEYQHELNNCLDLTTIDFSYNKINRFEFSDIANVNLHLRSFNLQNNAITYVQLDDFFFLTRELVLNLRNNQITVVDFSKSFVAENNSPIEIPITVLLDGNPIDCMDCKNYALTKYFKNKLNLKYQKAVFISPTELKCAGVNPKLDQALVSSIDPDDFKCRINISCPESCACSKHMLENMLVVDCSYKNLSTLPDLTNISVKEFNGLEVELQGNALAKGPEPNMGYEGVKKLNVSFNEMKNLTWVPQNLLVLDLQNNYLENIPYETLKLLNDSTDLRGIAFFGNPWRCQCSSVNLTNFIRQHGLKVINPKETFCNDDTTLLLNVNESTACSDYTIIILSLSIILLVLILASATAAMMFYKYNYDIKAWLYYHRLFLRCLRVKYKEQQYDVFVSYSERDNDKMGDIMNVLQERPEGYKICLPFLHAEIGEFQLDAIADLIKNSKCTLVLLSKHFLDDLWAQHKLRVSHLDAMHDRSKKVIVVIFDDVDIEKLDEELYAYLKTNTYVLRKDPWFWYKMIYSLPHKNQFDKHKRLEKIESVKMEPTVASNGVLTDSSLLKTVN